MNENNGTSVRRTYSSYPPKKIHRYKASARMIECKLIVEMARAANLLVVKKIIEDTRQPITINDITEVLHAAQKKVLELPEAKNLPINWPFKTANQFYFDTIDFLTGKQTDKELSMAVVKKGYEAEIMLLFGLS
jgi:hypothetical protein